MVKLLCLLLVSVYTGNPDFGAIASYLVDAVGQESSQDGVERLVAMHFKDGLVHMQNYKTDSTASEKRHDAELARQSFISASNVEKDSLRIARAKMYMSSTSRLLGNPATTVYWAEQAYKDLSRAESLAWRLMHGTEDTPLAMQSAHIGATDFLYPICGDRSGELELFKQQIEITEHPTQHILGTFFSNMRQQASGDFSGSVEGRHIKLREIYAYKAIIAKFLKRSGSTIKELGYPVTIALNNSELGANAAVRLSDEECSNRKAKTPVRH